MQDYILKGGILALPYGLLRHRDVVYNVNLRKKFTYSRLWQKRPCHCVSQLDFFAVFEINGDPVPSSREHQSLKLFWDLVKLRS